MVVTYGRRCPPGHLPAYSVDTEAEAIQLIRRCCELVFIDSTQRFGYIAAELKREQTLENLDAFGVRLHAEYTKMKEEKIR